MKIQLLRNNGVKFLEPATLKIDGNAVFSQNPEQDVVYVIGYEFVPETDIERVICARFLPPIGWLSRPVAAHPGDIPRLHINLSELWQAVATRITPPNTQSTATELRQQRIELEQYERGRRDALEILRRGILPSEPLNINNYTQAELQQIELERFATRQRELSPNNYSRLRDLFVEEVINSSNLNNENELDRAAQMCWNAFSLNGEDLRQRWMELEQRRLSSNGYQCGITEPDRATRSCSNCEYFLKLGSTKICNSQPSQTPSDREDSATDCTDWQQINVEERKLRNGELQKQVRQVKTPD